jgi:hypothetical protein
MREREGGKGKRERERKERGQTHIPICAFLRKIIIKKFLS